MDCLSGNSALAGPGLGSKVLEKSSSPRDAIWGDNAVDSVVAGCSYVIHYCIDYVNLGYGNVEEVTDWI